LDKELELKYQRIVNLLLENPETNFSEDYIKNKYVLTDTEYEEIRLALYVCNYIE
jgi:hypothetical protein